MIRMPMFCCTNCYTEIQPFDKYLQIGTEVLCEYCINDLMQEYDPEGDYADEMYDERNT